MMLKNFKYFQKLGIIFLLCVPFLVGCTDDTFKEEPDNEIVGQEINNNNEAVSREIVGTVVELFENRIDMQEAESSEEDLEDGTSGEFLFANDDEDRITVFFNEETVVETVEVINADWQNPIISEGTTDDISIQDMIRIYGHGEENEIFAEKIVITRMTFTVS